MWIGFASDGVETLQQGKTLVMQGENMQAAKSLRRARQSSDPHIRNMASFWLDSIQEETNSEKIEDIIFSTYSRNGYFYETAASLSQIIARDPLDFQTHLQLGDFYLRLPVHTYTDFQPCAPVGEYTSYRGLPYAALQESDIAEALVSTNSERIQYLRFRLRLDKTLSHYYFIESHKCNVPCCRDLYERYSEHAKETQKELEDMLRSVQNHENR